MSNQCDKKATQFLCISIGVLIAVLYFDPFTVKSIKNAVLYGERQSLTYQRIDEVRTGSVLTEEH